MGNIIKNRMINYKKNLDDVSPTQKNLDNLRFMFVNLLTPEKNLGD